MYYKMEYESPLGPVTLASKEGRLVGVWFVGQKHYMKNVEGPVLEKKDEPVLVAAAKWLDGYFEGEQRQINELPLAPEGSSFQQLICELLCEIPYGEVVTYGEVAKRAAHRLGRESMSAQAVGQAIGHNPISIIIPCHRVIGVNGRLTGYAGGLDVKNWLLAHEGAKL